MFERSSSPDSLISQTKLDFVNAVDAAKIEPDSQSHTTDDLSMADPPPAEAHPAVRFFRWLRWEGSLFVYFVIYSLGLTIMASALIYVSRRFAPLFEIAFVDLWTSLGLPEGFATVVAPLASLFLIFFFLLVWMERKIALWYRDRVMPPQFRINRNEIMFGALKVRYAYNEQNLSVATADGKIAMVVDRSCVIDASVDEQAQKTHPLRNWWVGDKSCPPVTIRIGSGRHMSILRIYGGYFEHRDNIQKAAQDFATGLQQASVVAPPA